MTSVGSWPFAPGGLLNLPTGENQSTCGWRQPGLRYCPCGCGAGPDFSQGQSLSPPVFAACGRKQIGLRGLGRQGWDLTSGPVASGNRCQSLRAISTGSLCKRIIFQAAAGGIQVAAGGRPVHPGWRGSGWSVLPSALSSTFCSGRAATGPQSSGSILSIFSAPGTPRGPPRSPSPEPSRGPADSGPGSPVGAPAPSRNRGGGRHSALTSAGRSLRCAPRARSSRSLQASAWAFPGFPVSPQPCPAHGSLALSGWPSSLSCLPFVINKR